jgi:tRNA threonylcarbamoyladenosine biosynthesis protein TsaE
MLPLHAPIVETRTLLWQDEADCQAFAQALAARPGLRDASVALHGPLGAGKTTFVRHLLRALGVQGRIKSPTYAVLEPHQVGALAISHFDFYRFNDPREWADAGFRDLFAAPGLKLAEWPDKAADLLPTPDLLLHIEPVGEALGEEAAREVTASACTPRGLALLEAEGWR